MIDSLLVSNDFMKFHQRRAPPVRVPVTLLWSSTSFAWMCGK